PDGKRVLVRDLNGYALVDVGTGDEIHRLSDLGGWPTFSPDGRLLASTVSERINDATPARTRSILVLHRVPDGKVVGRQAERGRRLGFSVDGKTLAVSGYVRAGGSYTVSLIEVATLKERRQFTSTSRRPFAEPVLAFAPDGRILAEADDRDITLRDVATGQVL